MRAYGQVQCSWWGHPDNQALSDTAKILYLYLLTGPHSNGLGCYRLPVGYISADTGFSEDRIRDGLDEMSSSSIAMHCQATQFVMVKKFLKWNAPANRKVAIAREREYGLIPEGFAYRDMVAGDILLYGAHFSEAFLSSIRNHIGSRSDTISKPLKSRSDTVVRARSDTVSKQEHNITKPNNLKDPSPGIEFAGEYAANLTATGGGINHLARETGGVK